MIRIDIIIVDIKILAISTMTAAGYHRPTRLISASVQLKCLARQRACPLSSAKRKR